MGEVCHEKGIDYALGHMGDSLNFVASGLGERLHDGWGHSYPAGHRHHRVSGPTYAGTKNIPAIWPLAGEERRSALMKLIMLIGVFLIILGVVALVYQGITYTSREKIIDSGPIQVTRETRKIIPLSPLFGGIALAGGIVLVIMGAKNKR
jgi:hypothetical protein